jgi:SAM-dependent methyltransferase
VKVNRATLTAHLRLWARRILPVTTRRQIVRHTRWPPVGLVNFGSLRRLRPISPHWGTERGQPIDRRYIEHFLNAHAADVQGRVLEIGADTYTRKFGGSRVSQSEVLHVAEQKSGVTLLGDLTQADHIGSDTYDCIILTQTLNAIYDLPAAIRTVHRTLKPGGVVLATVPGISKISRYDMERWGYFWSFTTQSTRRLFEAAFGEGRVEVRAYGNVLAATAFLHGLAAEELRSSELDFVDPDYELLIALRAVK